MGSANPSMNLTSSIAPETVPHTFPPGATVTVAATTIITTSTESQPVSSRATDTYTSRTSTAPVPTRSVTNTSLGGGTIAGLAVASAVAAWALIALLLLLILKRRNTKKYEVVNETAESKLSPNFVGNDKATTAGLKKTLEDRDATVRQLQAALLKRGQQQGEPVLDNVQLRDRFGALASSINDWVLTYFKDFQGTTAIPQNVVGKLKQVAPQYLRLMHQPRTRFLVVRAVTGQVLFENFDNGSLVGNSDFVRIREELLEGHPGNEYKECEALTTRLLERTQKHQSSRGSAVEAVAKEIDELTRGLTGLHHSEQRFRALKQLVDNTADLAILLAKQPALYRLVEERPGTRCDPNTMEDVLQDLNSQAITNRNVQATVFPAVQKLDFEQGSISQTPTCIRKAQVIVS